MSQIGPAAVPTGRVLMLGLDAASLPFIQENLATLPTLASLIKKCAVNELECSAGCLSASVWPTFSAGELPGEHGQYFPFQWFGQGRKYRRIADPRWSQQFDVAPFWHRVAQAGVATIAFDVANALHDERAPCLQITNWSYQSSGAATASHPNILKELRRRFGRRPIGAEVPVPKTARQCAAIRDQLVAAVRAKADATLYLMQQPWRLFVTGWYEMHRAGHNLWPVDGDFASAASPDAMLAVYEETDRQLGRILTALDAGEAESSLLLFALHGMGPNRAQDHFLSEILRRLNDRYLGREPTPSDDAVPLNAMAFLRRALPAGLQYRAAGMLGEQIQDWVVNRSLTAGRDWDRTPSFPLLSGGEGLIRLSVRNRESRGFFDPGSPQLDHYRDWLCDRLRSIKVCGTGEPLIQEIVDVDQAFPGVRRSFLPDLILKWGPEAPARRIFSPDIGEIEVSLATGRGGNHKDCAFLIAKGPKGFAQAAAQVRDIAHLGQFAASCLLGEGCGQAVDVQSSD
jgi:predicted AlkP superfamily phosphohydrolase/phosphomutase